MIFEIIFYILDFLRRRATACGKCSIFSPYFPSFCCRASTRCHLLDTIQINRMFVCCTSVSEERSISPEPKAIGAIQQNFLLCVLLRNV